MTVSSGLWKMMLSLGTDDGLPTGYHWGLAYFSQREQSSLIFPLHWLTPVRKKYSLVSFITNAFDVLYCSVGITI